MGKSIPPPSVSTARVRPAVLIMGKRSGTSPSGMSRAKRLISARLRFTGSYQPLSPRSK